VARCRDPTQCWRCKAFGHASNQCKAKPPPPLGPSSRPLASSFAPCSSTTPASTPLHYQHEAPFANASSLPSTLHQCDAGEMDMCLSLGSRSLGSHGCKDSPLLDEPNRDLRSGPPPLFTISMKLLSPTPPLCLPPFTSVLLARWTCASLLAAARWARTVARTRLCWMSLTETSGAAGWLVVIRIMATMTSHP
jgi:hypothetical protein